MKKCKTCGTEAKGYKCEKCGVEAEEHDPNHQNSEYSCTGANCVLKCVGCGQVETKCPC